MLFSGMETKASWNMQVLISSPAMGLATHRLALSQKHKPASCLRTHTPWLSTFQVQTKGPGIHMCQSHMLSLFQTAQSSRQSTQIFTALKIGGRRISTRPTPQTSNRTLHCTPAPLPTANRFPESTTRVHSRHTQRIFRDTIGHGASPRPCSPQHPPNLSPSRLSSAKTPGC